MARILQVVPYLLDQPLHGGQIRCKEINRALKQRGHQVTLLTVHSSIFGTTNLGPQTHLPDSYREAILGSFWSSRVPHLAATDFFNSYAGQEKLKRAVGKGKYDVVWVDQHFMVEPLSKVFKGVENQPRIVNSTQNIEHEMLFQYLPESAVSGLTKQQVIAKTKFDEIRAAEIADINVGVTEADRAQLQKWNHRAQSFVLKNGAYDLPPEKPSKKLLSEISALTSGRNFGLYIASGHPPNINGFAKMLGRDLGFLPPDSLLICAGSVASGLRQFLLEGLEGKGNSFRLALIESVSEQMLFLLRDQAKFIFLPITEGGGSNLKTAEALLSPGEIVATTHSFRGYETRSKDPGVNLADSPGEFREKLREIALREKGQTYSRTSTPESPLTWADALCALDLIIPKTGL